ncbi:MAG: DNA primase [Proteobacteria bacterium]|nr:DNA primase [Pseudomonadota bacterium]
MSYIWDMRFGPHLLDEILRRTDLVQLVGKRVKLTRKGRVMWGCCPFHQEKSPSFKVENERRTYKCFGCGAGGDAFKWMMETEGLSFPEAVERLASDAGVELPKWSAEDEAREEKKKSLYDVVEVACQFFEEQLRAKNGSEARDYLVSRGLNGEAAKQFRLGYAPDSNAALKDHLYAKSIPLDDMVAAGLVRPQDGDRPARDFFYNRVIFPIADTRGRIVAFGARALDPDAKPKYINTGETQLFSKGHLLYNFATARAAALKAQTIILAEGYMDVIALVRAGFDYAVAPLGTAFTEDQLHLLWRTAPEPILCFDGDEAGLRAGLRAAHLALAHLKPGFSLRFAFLPPGEDPDTLIKREGQPAMRKVLEAAEPLAKVLWRAETEGKDFSTPERRAGLERALGEIVSRISDQKIADYYRRDFDQKVFESFKRRAPAQQNYPPRDRQQDRRSGFPGGRRVPPRPGFAGGGETVSPAVKNSLLARSGRSGARGVKEVELSVILFRHPDLAVRHAEIVAELPLSDRILDRFRRELLNLAASGSRLENQGLEAHLVRHGMSDLVERLNARALASGEIAPADGMQGIEGAEDIEARWLRAASQLRDMAETGPERARAFERFKSEGTEESWRDAANLLPRHDE